MATRIAAAAGALLASGASGQLVLPPIGDPSAFTRELLRADAEAAAVLLGSARGAQAPDHITSPTICDPGVKQHAGYIPVAKDTSYFFWMFESRSNPARDPLVIWLNGGPGCSSQMGLLAENGPCTVTDSGDDTKLNPHSWNTEANVLWIDQPAATGFSTGNPVTHNEAGVARNMQAFLEGFYERLPQYAKHDLYIFGESYAGHYVPAIAHHLLLQAQAANRSFPLRGIGVGNGLTEPVEQYKWYPDMARDGGKSEGGSLEKGVITSTLELAAMRAAVAPCVALIKECNDNGTVTCNAAVVTCNYGEMVPYQLSGYNPYDMRIKCEVPPLCYNFEKITTFLNSPKTQAQLGVNKRWKDCNMLVNVAFQGDWMKNFGSTTIPDLIAGGVRVLIYAGDVDYICNWLGNKKWTLGLEWPHKDEFNAAEDAPFVVEGRHAGRVRSTAGLSFLQVYQAGHMVPMDQPVAALQMLRQFTVGKWESEVAKQPEFAASSQVPITV